MSLMDKPVNVNVTDIPEWTVLHIDTEGYSADDEHPGRSIAVDFENHTLYVSTNPGAHYEMFESMLDVGLEWPEVTKNIWFEDPESEYIDFSFGGSQFTPEVRQGILDMLGAKDLQPRTSASEPQIVWLDSEELWRKLGTGKPAPTPFNAGYKYLSIPGEPETIYIWQTNHWGDVHHYSAMEAITGEYSSPELQGEVYSADNSDDDHYVYMHDYPAEQDEVMQWIEDALMDRPTAKTASSYPVVQVDDTYGDDEDYWDNDRLPFIFVPENETIYIGTSPGMHHAPIHEYLYDHFSQDEDEANDRYSTVEGFIVPPHGAGVFDYAKYDGAYLFGRDESGDAIRAAEQISPNGKVYEVSSNMLLNTPSAAPVEAPGQLQLFTAEAPPPISPTQHVFIPFTDEELAQWELLDPVVKNNYENRAKRFDSRARERGIPGRINPRKLFALTFRYNGMCAYCGQPGAEGFDHVIPLWRGGTNTVDNLLPAHTQCNKALDQWDQDKLPKSAVLIRDNGEYFDDMRWIATDDAVYFSEPNYIHHMNIVEREGLEGQDYEMGYVDGPDTVSLNVNYAEKTLPDDDPLRARVLEALAEYLPLLDPEDYDIHDEPQSKESAAESIYIIPTTDNSHVGMGGGWPFIWLMDTDRVICGTSIAYHYDMYNEAQMTIPNLENERASRGRIDPNTGEPPQHYAWPEYMPMRLREELAAAVVNYNNKTAMLIREDDYMDDMRWVATADGVYFSAPDEIHHAMIVEREDLLDDEYEMGYIDGADGVQLIGINGEEEVLSESDPLRLRVLDALAEYLPTLDPDDYAIHEASFSAEAANKQAWHYDENGDIADMSYVATWVYYPDTGELSMVEGYWDTHPQIMESDFANRYDLDFDSRWTDEMYDEFDNLNTTAGRVYKDLNDGTYFIDFYSAETAYAKDQESAKQAVDAHLGVTTVEWTGSSGSIIQVYNTEDDMERKRRWEQERMSADWDNYYRWIAYNGEVVVQHVSEPPYAHYTLAIQQGWAKEFEDNLVYGGVIKGENQEVTLWYPDTVNRWPAGLRAKVLEKFNAMRPQGTARTGNSWSVVDVPAEVWEPNTDLLSGFVDAANKTIYIALNGTHHAFIIEMLLEQNPELQPDDLQMIHYHRSQDLIRTPWAGKHLRQDPEIAAALHPYSTKSALLSDSVGSALHIPTSTEGTEHTPQVSTIGRSRYAIKRREPSRPVLPRVANPLSMRIAGLNPDASYSWVRGHRGTTVAGLSVFYGHWLLVEELERKGENIINRGISRGSSLPSDTILLSPTYGGKGGGTTTWMGPIQHRARKPAPENRAAFGSSDILYYVSLRSARDSILEHGIDASLATDSPNANVDDYDEGTYLWETLALAQWYAEGHDADIWQVDVRGLEIAPDETGAQTVHGAWYTPDPISPDRIKPAPKNRVGNGSFDILSSDLPAIAFCYLDGHLEMDKGGHPFIYETMTYARGFSEEEMDNALWGWVINGKILFWSETQKQNRDAQDEAVAALNAKGYTGPVVTELSQVRAALDFSKGDYPYAWMSMYDTSEEEPPNKTARFHEGLEYRWLWRPSTGELEIWSNEDEYKEHYDKVQRLGWLHEFEEEQIVGGYIDGDSEGNGRVSTWYRTDEYESAPYELVDFINQVSAEGSFNWKPQTESTARSTARSTAGLRQAKKITVVTVDGADASGANIPVILDRDRDILYVATYGHYQIYDYMMRNRIKEPASEYHGYYRYNTDNDFHWYGWAGYPSELEQNQIEAALLSLAPKTSTPLMEYRWIYDPEQDKLVIGSEMSWSSHWQLARTYGIEEVLMADDGLAGMAYGSSIYNTYSYEPIPAFVKEHVFSLIEQDQAMALGISKTAERDEPSRFIYLPQTGSFTTATESEDVEHAELLDEILHEVNDPDITADVFDNDNWYGGWIWENNSIAIEYSPEKTVEEHLAMQELLRGLARNQKTAGHRVFHVEGEGPDWSQYGGKYWWSGIYNYPNDILYVGDQTLHHEHIMEKIYGPRWYNESDNENWSVTWYEDGRDDRVTPQIAATENPELAEWLKAQSPYKKEEPGPPVYKITDWTTANGWAFVRLYDEFPSDEESTYFKFMANVDDRRIYYWPHPDPSSDDFDFFPSHYQTLDEHWDQIMGPDVEVVEPDSLDNIVYGWMDRTGEQTGAISDGERAFAEEENVTDAVVQKLAAKPPTWFRQRYVMNLDGEIKWGQPVDLDRDNMNMHESHLSMVQGFIPDEDIDVENWYGGSVNYKGSGTYVTTTYHPHNSREEDWARVGTQVWQEFNQNYPGFLPPPAQAWRVARAADDIFIDVTKMEHFGQAQPDFYKFFYDDQTDALTLWQIDYNSYPHHFDVMEGWPSREGQYQYMVYKDEEGDIDLNGWPPFTDSALEQQVKGRALALIKRQRTAAREQWTIKEVPIGSQPFDPGDDDYMSDTPFIVNLNRGQIWIANQHGYHESIYEEASAEDYEALFDDRVSHCRIGDNGYWYCYDSIERDSAVKSLIKQALESHGLSTQGKIANDRDGRMSFWSYMYIGSPVNRLYATGADYHYSLMEEYPEILEEYEDVPQVWGRIRENSGVEYAEADAESDWLRDTIYGDPNEGFEDYEEPDEEARQRYRDYTQNSEIKHEAAQAIADWIQKPVLMTQEMYYPRAKTSNEEDALTEIKHIATGEDHGGGVPFIWTNFAFYIGTGEGYHYEMYRGQNGIDEYDETGLRSVNKAYGRYEPQSGRIVFYADKGYTHPEFEAEAARLLRSTKFPERPWSTFEESKIGPSLETNEGGFYKLAHTVVPSVTDNWDIHKFVYNKAANKMVIWLDDEYAQNIDSYPTMPPNSDFETGEVDESVFAHSEMIEQNGWDNWDEEDRPDLSYGLVRSNGSTGNIMFWWQGENVEFADLEQAFGFKIGQTSGRTYQDTGWDNCDWEGFSKTAADEEDYNPKVYVVDRVGQKVEPRFVYDKATDQVFFSDPESGAVHHYSIVEENGLDWDTATLGYIVDDGVTPGWNNPEWNQEIALKVQDAWNAQKDDPKWQRLAAYRYATVDLRAYHGEANTRTSDHAWIFDLDTDTLHYLPQSGHHIDIYENNDELFDARNLVEGDWNAGQIKVWSGEMWDEDVKLKIRSALNQAFGNIERWAELEPATAKKHAWLEEELQNFYEGKWLRWLWDGRNDQIYIWDIHPHEFEENTHNEWIEDLGLFEIDEETGEEPPYAVGYIGDSGAIQKRGPVPDEVLRRLEEWSTYNAPDDPYKRRVDYDVDRVRIAVTMGPPGYINDRYEEKGERDHFRSLAFIYYPATGEMWAAAPKRGYGTSHGDLFDEIGIDTDWDDYITGRVWNDGMVGIYDARTEEDDAAILAHLENQTYTLLNPDPSQDFRIAASYNVVEEEALDPEDRHDAWVYVIPDRTIWFLHGGHHSEIYETMVDPDEVEMKGYWAGDIQNGEIRFYDFMRHDDESPFEDPEFNSVMNVVKGLSRDYDADSISIDFQNHAKIQKKAWDDTMARWFYDPINGLTVWKTMTYYDRQEESNPKPVTQFFHSEMAQRLYGEDWYDHDDHCGGYIYHDGRVTRTYSSYDNQQINVDGVAAAKAWYAEDSQLALDPPLLPNPFVTAAKGVDAMFKWTYPPGGPIHVWPVDQWGMPQHLDVTGPNSPDAQGHIYLTGPDVAVFVHPNRPGPQFGHQVGPKFEEAAQQLRDESLAAVKIWATENLQAPFVGTEPRNREFDGMKKRKWWTENQPLGRTKRKPYRKRKHLRKHHMPLYLMGDWNVVKYPDLDGARPAYPEGGQVDTTGIEAGTHS
jgi:hypothetical protein